MCIYTYYDILCMCVCTHRYNILRNCVYYMKLHLKNSDKVETVGQQTSSQAALRWFKQFCNGWLTRRNEPHGLDVCHILGGDPWLGQAPPLCLRATCSAEKVSITKLVYDALWGCNFGSFTTCTAGNAWAGHRKSVASEGFQKTLKQQKCTQGAELQSVRLTTPPAFPWPTNKICVRTTNMLSDVVSA